MQIAAVRLLRTHGLGNFAYASKIADRSTRIHLCKTAVAEGDFPSKASPWGEAVTKGD